MTDETITDSWLPRIGRAVDAVRAWGERVVKPETVEPGSSLAGDDQRWPQFPPSVLAWHSLGAAVDHLGLLADNLTDPAASLRPTAPFTLTRTALLAASQAVWVLAPSSRDERCARALVLVEDEHHHHVGFVDSYLKDDFVTAEIAEEGRAELVDLASRLREAKAAARKKLGTSPGRYVSTAMMSDAAAHLYDVGEKDGWMRMALGYEWRVSSAAAHARMWPLHVRQHVEDEQQGDGTFIRRQATTTQELGQSLAAATLMTSEAFRLWDLRRQRHVST